MTSAPPLLDTTFQARNGTPLTVRHCRGFAELDACVNLQQQTWSYSDREILPRKAFILAQELGGQVIGAFEPLGDLAAFAMSMPAFALGSTQPQLHSHMLAVLPIYRDSGLGARLKLAQRDDALARGIHRMTWTFDPLRAKNAFFNLHRLGAIARRYSADFYGVSSSRLQGGLPTDRLHAEWWMTSHRVQSRVDAILRQALPAGAGNTPKHERPGGTAPPVLHTIHLPHQVETQDEARATQSANRQLFLEAFARNLVVTDFIRDPEGGGTYQLEPWSPPHSSEHPIKPEASL